MWRSFFLAALLMLTTAGMGHAEEAYKIQPGDVLNVSVSPQATYGKVITVQPDGKVNYDVVGEVKAAGLTIAELTKLLTTGLEKELNNPRVTVSLQSSVPKQLPQITILGAVRTPGLYPIRPDWRLTEALAAAGGPTQSADLKRITMTRGDRTVRTLDLSANATTGEPKENVVVREGDLIIVPDAKVERYTVTILGEVAKPGAYEFVQNMTLLELLTTAGSPTPKANLKEVQLTRAVGGNPKKLDLLAMLKGQSEEANIKLEPGDTVLITDNKLKAYVFGEVAKQGEVPLQGGEDIVALMLQVGGPNNAADLRKASIRRRDKSGASQSIPIDLEKVMVKGSKETIAIEDGDLLFIPPKGQQKQKRSILDYLGPFRFLLGGGF